MISHVQFKILVKVEVRSEINVLKSDMTVLISSPKMLILYDDFCRKAELRKAKCVLTQYLLLVDMKNIPSVYLSLHCFIAYPI